MSELRKVYLPKWMTWLGLAFLVPLWLWITYRVFFTPGGRADLGVDGWLVSTAAMGVLAVVMVLMGRRKLPAYLVEVGEDGEP